MTLTSPLPSALAWVAKAAGAAIRKAEPLAGATSSDVYGLETDIGDKLVLRLFTNQEWLSHEPDLAVHEAWALQTAAQADIPTPELIASDETGEKAGAPAVLMTCLPGKVQLQPQDRDRWLAGMAEGLVPIHALSAGDSAWAYYPYVDLQALAPPAWSQNRAGWERAIAIAQGPPLEEWTCFIHRDYHPNNVLWDGERFSGIVDWVNACRGPAGIDVAWCRQNLALLFGVETADRFLDHCCRADPSFSYHPHWDLMGVIEMIPFEPNVYPGWTAHGITHLTPALIRERADAYLASILIRI